MTDEELLARLLYRDGMMLVIDKPAGIAVHRGPKGGENLEDYFHALRFGLPRNPALAHRLDRETSGCLVGRRGKRRGAMRVRKKLGLTPISEKAGAERVYRVPAGQPTKSKPKIAAQAAA